MMSSMDIDLRTVTAQDFELLIGRSFSVAGEEGGQTITELVLSSVEASKFVIPEGRAGFSLFFDGPGDVSLAQQIHFLSHEDAGTIAIFLVPISGDEKARRYQAVFN